MAPAYSLSFDGAPPLGLGANTHFGAFNGVNNSPPEEDALPRPPPPRTR